MLLRWPRLHELSGLRSSQDWRSGLAVAVTEDGVRDALRLAGWNGA